MRALGGERLGAIAGVAFAALYVASLFGVLDIPDGSNTDAEVQAAFADDRGGIILGVYLLAAAGFLFLWFLGALRAWLREGGTQPALESIVLGGGLIYVAMLFSASATWGVFAFATAFDEIPEPVDAAAARALTQLGFVLLLIFGLLGASALILATSIAVLRNRLPGRWVAWAGLPIAALLLLGPFYVPQLLVPLWVVMAAFAFLVRPAGPTREAGAYRAHEETRQV